MPRVIRIIPADAVDHARTIDSVILDGANRLVHHAVLFGIRGARAEVDFDQPIRLGSGDALELDDGSLVEVVAEAEPLLEARPADLTSFARLAWQLGDRHVPVQILPNRLRVRRDPAIEQLIIRLGARVRPIVAPFDPQSGAYLPSAASASSHDQHHGHHHHGHRHDHAHHHSDCQKGAKSG